MYLRFPTPSIKTFRRGFFLLITLLLLSGIVAAQNTKHAQAQKLLVEAQQLIDEGSTASLTKAIEKLEAARTVATSFSNLVREAALLSEIDSLYIQLDQNQKALQAYAQSL